MNAGGRSRKGLSKGSDGEQNSRQIDPEQQGAGPGRILFFQAAISLAAGNLDRSLLTSEARLVIPRLR
jgi:hypothetical protein